MTDCTDVCRLGRNFDTTVNKQTNLNHIYILHIKIMSHIFILSIFMGQAETHVILDTIPPGFSQMPLHLLLGCTPAEFGLKSTFLKFNDCNQLLNDCNYISLIMMVMICSASFTYTIDKNNGAIGTLRQLIKKRVKS